MYMCVRVYMCLNMYVCVRMFWYACGNVFIVCICVCTSVSHKVTVASSCAYKYVFTYVSLYVCVMFEAHLLISTYVPLCPCVNVSTYVRRGIHIFVCICHVFMACKRVSISLSRRVAATSSTDVRICTYLYVCACVHVSAYVCTNITFVCRYMHTLLYVYVYF